MRLVRHLVDVPATLWNSGSVVTIGSYDGLHLGHQRLLDAVRNKSREDRLQSVVMSFEPTPREFFQADKPPARLMRLREKFDALAASGIDLVYCPKFSSAMRQIAAPEHGVDGRGLSRIGTPRDRDLPPRIERELARIGRTLDKARN